MRIYTCAHTHTCIQTRAPANTHTTTHTTLTLAFLILHLIPMHCVIDGGFPELVREEVSDKDKSSTAWYIRCDYFVGTYCIADYDFIWWFFYPQKWPYLSLKNNMRESESLKDTERAINPITCFSCLGKAAQETPTSCAARKFNPILLSGSLLPSFLIHTQMIMIFQITWGRWKRRGKCEGCHGQSKQRET